MNSSESSMLLEKTENRLLHQARLVLYQFLSLALSCPQEKTWKRLKNPEFKELLEGAVSVLKEVPRDSSFSLAPLELSPEFFDFSLMQQFFQNSYEEIAEEYQRTFGLLMSRECPPYQTEYCPQTFSVYRSHQIADIAGYYAAFGIEPSRQFPLRADHIVLEFEFMAWVISKALYAEDDGESDGEAICKEAQKKFFQEHLVWWVPAFASALHRKAEGITNDSNKEYITSRSYYGQLSILLASFIPLERNFLQVAPPTELITPNMQIQEESSSPENCEECPLASSDPKSEFTCEENPS
ncbi:MAG: molecular chaperone TorD family protein [Planctomycetota bacterium]